MATTMKLIAKNVLGSDTATVTFSSIPGTMTDLLIIVSARSSRAEIVDTLKMTFNGSSSGYSDRAFQVSGTNVVSYAASSATYNEVGLVTGSNATANTFGSGEIYIPNYAGSTNKSVSATTVYENNATAGYINATACLWANTAAITSVALGLTTGPNFKSGSSFFLYGITKA